MKKLILNLPRRQKQFIAATTDFVCLPLVFCFAVSLHFDNYSFALLEEYFAISLSAPLLSIPIFQRFGLYRAVIRFIDQKIVATIIISSTISVSILILATRISLAAPLSPTIFWIYEINLVLYVLTSRFLARGFFSIAKRTEHDVERVAVYGAGQAGVQLIHALAPGREYLPVAFIDDNFQLRNTTIGGIKVHSPAELPQLIASERINSILLAMPSITRQRQREIIDRLAPLKLKIKVTPSNRSLVEGVSRVEDVRQIEIEDLLTREPVVPDSALLTTCIQGKTVMISGAGGSIGSELCRQIIALRPTRLIMLDRCEFALYTIEQQLQELRLTQSINVELTAFLGSVTDYEKCRNIMQSFSVDTVYHAAAYKHVPLVEHNPVEGINNNVFGTLNFANAAIAAHVKCFVLISTDKAVRPTNVMGSTKRLAELILQALARQGAQTCFCMVRFGNVLGSSGSVVPLFRKQIAAGGPITLTHPEITRYFMTIPEAAQLVIQAGAMGKGGDVFVLDMGKPVRIADLAVRMVHLSGQEVKTPTSPNGSIEIKYVGLRPGEKLFEELLIGTNVTGTEHSLILRAQEAEIDWPFLELMLKQLEDACKRMDHKAIRNQLRKMVREYHPNTEIADLIWQERENLSIGKNHLISPETVAQV